MISDQYPPIIGGSERQAKKLSEELVRRGHRVTVLTGNWSGDLPSSSTDKGVSTERLYTMHQLFSLPGLRRFKQDVYGRSLATRLQVLLQDADIVHVHSMQRGAVTALREAARVGVPVLVKETNSGEKNSFHRLHKYHRGERMRQTLLDDLRHVVVLNDEAESQYRALPFRNLRIHRAFNGVEIPDIPAQWRHHEQPTVLSLSRLRPEKGVSLLLDAFARVAGEFGSWRLRICGDGPESEALARQVVRLGLQERVELVGSVDDVKAELSNATLLALPSFAEGMSNSLLEALVMGVPAVATDVGSNRELLGEGVGWITPAGDVEALASALRMAMSHDSERRVRSERSRRRAADYSITAAAERYEQIYAAMLNVS